MGAQQAAGRLLARLPKASVRLLQLKPAALKCWQLAQSAGQNPAAALSDATETAGLNHAGAGYGAREYPCCSPCGAMDK